MALIEMWPVDRPRPYERNARTHAPEQIAQIAASIREFGFANPLLVDKTGVIIADAAAGPFRRLFGTVESLHDRDWLHNTNPERALTARHALQAARAEQTDDDDDDDGPPDPVVALIPEQATIIAYDAFIEMIEAEVQAALERIRGRAVEIFDAMDHHQIKLDRAQLERLARRAEPVPEKEG